MKIELLCSSRNRRARHVGEAMAEGLRRHDVRHVVNNTWSGAPSADMVIAYGWEAVHAFDAYKAVGRPFVYIDLGYWNRKPNSNRLGGHHKIVINARHPTAMIGKGFPGDRFEALNIEVRPWKKGGEHILVAGTSARTAIGDDEDPQAWERKAIKRIALHTERAIVYRPKPTPTWKNPPPLKGAAFSAPDEKLGAVLKRAWLVVTRHSNVSIDGLVMGVPCFCEQGVASKVSIPSLMDVERPDRGFDRMPFLHDLAYCQWTPGEMRRGSCWAWLRTQLSCT